MFYSRTQSLSKSSPTVARDAYGYENTTYIDSGVITGYVVKTAYEANEYNNLKESTTTYTIYATRDSECKEGDLIDGKYLISEVVPHATGNALICTMIDGFPQ